MKILTLAAASLHQCSQYQDLLACLEADSGCSTLCTMQAPQQAQRKGGNEAHLAERDSRLPAML